MKTHRMTELPLHARPAYVANGLVGLRVAPVPFTRGTALVGGYYGVSAVRATEELAEAVYPVGADLAVNGVWLSSRPECVRFVGQHYDFSCGELHSIFEFLVNEVTARVETFLFCSRTSPTVTLQETSVTVNRPCKLILQAHLDPRGLMGTLQRDYRPGWDPNRRDRDSDGVLLLQSRGNLSALGAAYVCDYQGDGLQQRGRNNYCQEEDYFFTDFQVDAKPGQRQVMWQAGSLVPGLLHAEPHWQAHRFVAHARQVTLARLREDNRLAWAELWRGRPRLIGADERWQDMADAAFFYLHSSVHSSSPCGIAPFGLSQRTAYSGHSFGWDSEAYMFPAVLLTAPKAARAMLDYCTRLVPAARDNARLNGYAGIQFPFQTALSGCEVTSFYSGGCGGVMLQFVIPAMAYAFLQYGHATGERRFIEQQALPLLEGTAEWICSRVRKTNRGYEMFNINGVDETIENIQNHGLTNVLCRHILRETVKLAERSGWAPAPEWREVAENMFIPIHAGTGTLEKHEGDARHLTMMAPDVLVLQSYPFGVEVSPQVTAASLAHQMKLAPAYLGFPMNSANCAVWATRLGDRRLALDCLEKGIAPRFVDPYFQFLESCNKNYPGTEDAATFVSGLGGFQSACLLGFTGLKLDENDPATWARHKIVLPEGWQAIEVERIFVRGKPVSLVARQGDAGARLV